MAHIRTQIRDAVEAALKASAPVLGLAGMDGEPERVQKSRSLPTTDDLKPLVLVYLRNATPETELENEAPRRYTVKSDLFVEFAHRIAASDNLEEEHDKAAEVLEAELELLEITLFGGLVNDALWKGTDLAAQTQGQRQSYLTQVKYELEYCREIGATPANDFLTSDSQVAVGDTPAEYPGNEVSLPQA